MKKREGASLKISYNFNHAFLNEPIFDELTGSLRTTVLHVLCAIRWFTKGSVGHLDLYHDKFAQDIGVGKAMVAKACRLLIDSEYIKITKYYQKNSNTPNRYVAIKVVTAVPSKPKKVVTGNPQGGNRGSVGGNREYTVYNYLNNYKQYNDLGINIPNHDINGVNPHQHGTLKWVAWEVEKQKSLGEYKNKK